MKKIKIKQSTIEGGGKGVFAGEKIKKGDTIEVCETLVINHKQGQILIKKTILGNYVFAHEDEKSVILTLGNGSMYNHRQPSNAEYYFDSDTNQMSYVAVKDIAKGEEIFINYGGKFDADYVIDFYEYD
jgi:SET domain-containing protein